MTNRCNEGFFDDTMIKYKGTKLAKIANFYGAFLNRTRVILTEKIANCRRNLVSNVIVRLRKSLSTKPFCAILPVLFGYSRDYP